ncbi:LOW QUALITY PROTEIN: hypothetical protein SETIT_9G304100v2 [Setaria italica]|uniref:Uncharacterized protein n=1 Tax=Setaria italica TaxID=4555 RepID=A0A368SME9_SETIT|nr:LOW QUALITY PROTEIN: hypothetical protein SETIT_9G304100v2 [Setaria italica]
MFEMIRTDSVWGLYRRLVTRGRDEAAKVKGIRRGEEKRYGNGKPACLNERAKVTGSAHWGTGWDGAGGQRGMVLRIPRSSPARRRPQAHIATVTHASLPSSSVPPRAPCALPVTFALRPPPPAILRPAPVATGRPPLRLVRHQPPLPSASGPTPPPSGLAPPEDKGVQQCEKPLGVNFFWSRSLNRLRQVACARPGRPRSREELGPRSRIDHGPSHPRLLHAGFPIPPIPQSLAAPGCGGQPGGSGGGSSSHISSSWICSPHDAGHDSSNQLISTGIAAAPSSLL